MKSFGSASILISFMFSPEDDLKKQICEFKLVIFFLDMPGLNESEHAVCVCFIWLLGQIRREPLLELIHLEI